jgi:hypothetical protein
MPMDVVQTATAQKAENVKRDMNISVLVKLKDQQKQEGRAAVALINAAQVTRGASEPGKGNSVDLVG